MDLLKLFRKKDTEDHSDKLECYCPCPKCGKKKLGFATSLDFINSTREHPTYNTSVICTCCFYQLVTSELQAKKYNQEHHAKISFYELNRRQWNQQYYKQQKQKGV